MLQAGIFADRCSGNTWNRRIIKTASLVKIKWKTQQITDYASFKFEPFDYQLTVDGDDLDPAKLVQLSMPEIDALVLAAKTQLDASYSKLMDDENNPSGFIAFVGDWVDPDNSKWQQGQHTLISAALNDANVEKQAGISAYEADVWEQSIFPGGPSVMSLAKTGLSIAGGGPWAGFALDMAVNVGKFANEGMSGFDEFFMSSMKSMGTAMVGEVAKVASGWTGDLSMKLGMGGIMTEVVKSTVSTAVSTYGNAAVNAFEIGPNGFRINKDTFKEGTAGAGMAMLKSGVTSLVQSSINYLGEQKLIDSTGRELSYGESYLQNVGKYANIAAGVTGQIFGLAQDQGVSFTIGTDLFAPSAKINHQDLFTVQFGGKDEGNLFNGNMNISFGGGGLSVSSIRDTIGAAQYFQNDKYAQFVGKNSSTHEGRTTMTIANSGISSQTIYGKNLSMNLMFGGLELTYGDFSGNPGDAHHGHADSKSNKIILSDKALSIGIGDYNGAGLWTGVAGREDFLVGLHNSLGTGDWSDQEMQESGLALSYSRAAAQVQSSIAHGYANEMGFQYSGEEADWQNRIDYAAATGDMSGFDNTGRDLIFMWTDKKGRMHYTTKYDEKKNPNEIRKEIYADLVALSLIGGKGMTKYLVETEHNGEWGGGYELHPLGPGTHIIQNPDGSINQQESVLNSYRMLAYNPGNHLDMLIFSGVVTGLAKASLSIGGKITSALAARGGARYLAQKAAIAMGTTLLGQNLLNSRLGRVLQSAYYTLSTGNIQRGVHLSLKNFQWYGQRSGAFSNPIRSLAYFRKAMTTANMNFVQPVYAGLANENVNLTSWTSISSYVLTSLFSARNQIEHELNRN